MDKKYIILILIIVVLILVVIGLAIQLQASKQVKPVVNNTTTNNAPANTTVEHINKDEKPSVPEADRTVEYGKKRIPGSVAFVPSVAGLIIAGEVIKDIIKLKKL